MHVMPPRREMERAWLARDAAYDGLFFFAVRSTGVFCRPSCPARNPAPANVDYFRDAASAQRAGYRPCRRCQPLRHDVQPAWVARLLSELDEDPALRITEAGLRARGIDPTTARRWFLGRYGMTFHAYARAQRIAGAWQGLRAGAAVDDVTFASGYESHSGFRAAFTRLIGASPVRSARAEPVLLDRIQSPLGLLLAGATDAGVALLEFAEPGRAEAQLAAVQRSSGGALLPGSNRHHALLRHELASYFGGALRRFTVPLVLAGTPFQQRVWELLRAIPYGETRSYEQIAAMAGAPAGMRAVGRANGANRVVILIPCHRVVRKDGMLGGYGGGLRRKEFLLALERRGAGETPLAQRTLLRP